MWCCSQPCCLPPCCSPPCCSPPCCPPPCCCDCCPADARAWKCDVKVFARAPPPPNRGPENNLSAICRIHRVNCNLLQRILLYNVQRNFYNGSTPNIWNECVYVPLCKNFESCQFESKSDIECHYAIKKLKQQWRKETKDDRVLIKALLREHPVGYKYDAAYCRTTLQRRKCKRKRLKTIPTNCNCIYESTGEQKEDTKTSTNKN